MKICVVHPKVCGRSAKKLAFDLNADRVNLSDSDRYDFTEFDLVFNFGSSREIASKAIINSYKAVSRCIDKRSTFQCLQSANIPIPDWKTNKKLIPNDWEIIVCRQDALGNRAKSLEYITDHSQIPDCDLYTNYYDHEFEMRIVVFKGVIVGRYIKEVVGDEWHFVEVTAAGLKKMDKVCLEAAKALEIDYVGFDVLAKDCEEFVILEANSGATLTDEVSAKICKLLKV